MAEREGFEPSVEVSPHTRLAGERLQPARPSLPESLMLKDFYEKKQNAILAAVIAAAFYFTSNIMAEGVGFEPLSLRHIIPKPLWFAKGVYFFWQLVEQIVPPDVNP